MATRMSLLVFLVISVCVSSLSCPSKCWPRLGNGICDYDCLIHACNYDYGDCNGCPTECMRYLNSNGICEPGCNIPECHYDHGDCVGCPSECKKDGDCQEKCNSASCEWDYGDCPQQPLYQYKTFN